MNYTEAEVCPHPFINNLKITYLKLLTLTRKKGKCKKEKFINNTSDKRIAELVRHYF